MQNPDRTRTTWTNNQLSPGLRLGLFLVLATFIILLQVHIESSESNRWHIRVMVINPLEDGWDAYLMWTATENCPSKSFKGLRWLIKPSFTPGNMRRSLHTAPHQCARVTRLAAHTSLFTSDVLPIPGGCGVTPMFHLQQPCCHLHLKRRLAESDYRERLLFAFDPVRWACMCSF